MLEQLERRLDALARGGELGALAGGRKGLEKESLRVVPDGALAPTPHPVELGSPLRHPAITTDYSEALLELVTPALESTRATRDYLCGLHRHVYARIGTERLWATSMPCRVEGDADVPIAEYGSSNAGRMKHVYRRGLGYRYGRVMQCIAGVHFNYSLPGSARELLAERDGARPGRAFDDALYLGLIRNFHRVSWLVPLLFGSSPALCRSFVGALPGSPAEALPLLGAGTLHEPHGTSLRMSPIGYRSPTQASLEISYASLDEYVESMSHAIGTPHPPYETVGVKVDGEYRQLNANLLQIENEFYASIRPKQPTASGEKPTHALATRGIEYVEMRLLDVDPFDPVGVSAEAMYLSECLLIACATAPSADYTRADRTSEQRSLESVASHGRAPGLELDTAIGNGSPCQLGHELVRRLEPIAEAIDEGDGASRRAVAGAIERLRDPSQLPSARVLAALGDGHRFFDFALAASEAHRKTHLDRDADVALERELDHMRTDSLAQTEALEADDSIGFDDYLAQYFGQRLGARDPAPCA